VTGPVASEMASARGTLSGLSAAGEAGLARPGFVWPKGRAVHLVARDIRRRDAVGEFCLQLADLLSENGVSAFLHAENWNPRETPAIGPAAELGRRLRPGDLIFFNFSTADPALRAIADLPARKLFYFHGITPPGFFEGYDAAMAARAAEGLAQLPLARKFDRLMSNSRVSAEELRQRGKLGAAAEVTVCPPVLGIRRWAAVRPSVVALPSTERFVLYVGRLAPHKSVHRLLMAFRNLAERDSRTGLVIVGHNTVPSYGRDLADLSASMAGEIGGRITFLSDVEIGALRYLYEKAALFAILSEHEGFCVPVLEALQFGLPILAGADPAIRELLGGVGSTETTDPAVVSGAMARLLDDPDWRREIVSGQQAQLARLDATTNGALVWQAFETVLGLDARPL
jgi:glycosyltransferase involved in cell wall biosynthesis